MDDLRQNITRKQDAKQTEPEIKKAEDLRFKVSNTAAIKQASGAGENNKKSITSDASAEKVILY